MSVWKRVGILTFVILVVSYWYQNVYNRNLSRTIVKHQYDFIIVGGGTAGCVVASRLSEDPSVSVLLIEAGPADNEYKISIPAAVPELQKTELDWQYLTEPQVHTMYGMIQNRSSWPRGKVLGGSSQLNYLMYVRGNKEDYDSWARGGAKGWSYEEVLPYFKKLENDQIHDDTNYFGKNGPISVELPRDGLESIGQAVIDALKENGIPHNPDYNGKSQIGSSFIYLNTKKGTRFGAAQAYIHPNIERPNLDILTEAHVTKILFDEEKRASGVLYKMKDGIERKVLGVKEIIVSGGTVGSAQLLMLSGIGRPQDLEPLGIPVVSPLEVGQNLQDHLIVAHPRIPSKSDCMVTVEKASSLSTFLNYFIWGTGYLSSTAIKVTAFVKLDPELPWPDFQICLLASGIILNNNFNYHDSVTKLLVEIQESYNLFAILLHPKSIGYIKLKSSNPDDHPIIQPNYFEAKEDYEAAIKSLKFLGKIIQSSPLKENFTGETEPLNGELPFTDNYYHFVARNVGVVTSYHPIGTCKMGNIDDPTTVVDPQLQVKGVTNLRVVDASVMPHLTSGNTHVPVLMIGEKASDIIKQHWNLK